MISVSLCMIVKNESAVLKRCLDSVSILADEIIVVDTGSTDDTKEIARSYTDKIYDYKWIGDFSAARNYAFSLANCDYIYSADADEIIDEENQAKFLTLKEALDPEVEIVQMYYANQLEYGSVYNFDRELRPKLFKRVRTFKWVEKIHETVRELPLVYDSDIEIIHKPTSNHAGRDLKVFGDMIASGECLSNRLFDFYSRELMVSGQEADFKLAEEYFTQIADDDDTSEEMLKTALTIIVKGAYIRRDYLKMYRYAMKAVALEPSSEICCLLGAYYEATKEYKEAAVWYYNAAFETQPVLNIKYGKEYPLKGLINVYTELGLCEEAFKYEKLLDSSMKEGC